MSKLDWLQRAPVVGKLWRYLWLNLEGISFVKSLLKDGQSERTRRLYTHNKELQIDPQAPVFRDRLREICEFYNVGFAKFLWYCLVYGAPNSRYFNLKLNEQFEGKTAPGDLKSAYEKAAFLYSLRLMLCYERYSDMEAFIDHVGLWRKSTRLEILDYGCGVADVGLLFSHFGCSVTIADLDDRKLDFARWRFSRRGYRPQVLAIADTEQIPDLQSEKYDLIVALELMEHVRDPLKLLRCFTTALKPNGYLYDTLGMRYRFNVVGGDHLLEAKIVVDSEEYYQYYRTNYLDLFGRDRRLKHLFQKIG